MLNKQLLEDIDNIAKMYDLIKRVLEIKKDANI